MVADDQMNNQSDTLFASRIPDASAAVIAGGKSSRFGSPKAAAILMDRQLIDYSIQAGYRISNEVFLVTADTVPFNNPFAPAIVDIYPDCGPMGGILTALLYATKPYVCTLPCDMPMISTEMFQVLNAHKTASRPVVARSEKGLEPLVAIWPVPAWNVLYYFIREDKNSIRHALWELEAIEVYIPGEIADYTPDLFTNINFREDLRKVNTMRPAI